MITFESFFADRTPLEAFAQALRDGFEVSTVEQDILCDFLSAADPGACLALCEQMPAGVTTGVH